MKPLTYTAVAALSLSFFLVPTKPVEAGGAGKFLGGVAVGAAGAVIGHKVYKHHKRKKAERRYNAQRQYSGKRYSGRSQADIDATYDIQTRLNALAYNAGTPDGITGRRTRAAIRAFQTDNQRPVTGKLSNSDIALLYELSNPIVAARAPATGVAGGAAVVAGAAGTAGATTAFVAEQQEAQTDPVGTPFTTPTGETRLAGLPSSETNQFLEVTAVQTAPTNSDEPYATKADRPDILSISVGEAAGDLRQRLATNGFENCEWLDGASFCEKDTSFGSDKIAVASADGVIHTITRKMSFDTPLAKGTILERMPASYGPLLDRADHTIAASPACGALLAAQPESINNIVQQSANGGNFNAASAAFSHACAYYFAIKMPQTETVSEVELTFFDAEPVIASMSGEVEVSTKKATKLDEELKF